MTSFQIVKIKFPLSRILVYGHLSVLWKGKKSFHSFLHVFSIICVCNLARALLGGRRLNAPPSGFSRIAKIRRRAAPPCFHPPYPSSFPQLLWKFRPNAMWGQVTRSGQVTQLQITFQSRHGHNVSGKVMKLSEYDEVISAYKTYISDFWYRCPQVRSFCDLPIISQWAKDQLRYIYFGARLFEWNHIV